MVRPTYNEANFLETVSVNLRGAATASAFVTNIDYDAKGQRVLIEYGNDTRTICLRSARPFGWIAVTTARLGFPAGQQTRAGSLLCLRSVREYYAHSGRCGHRKTPIFFRNQRVEPSNDYTYDAIYRLILASGREQLGLGAGCEARFRQPPVPTTMFLASALPRREVMATPSDFTSSSTCTIR